MSRRAGERGPEPASQICEDLALTLWPLVTQSEGMIHLRVLTAVLLALSCAGCGSTLEGSPPSPAGEETVVPPAAPALQEMRDLTPTEKAVLADGFSSGFDNPEAARFRWAKIPKISTDAARALSNIAE